MSMTRRTESRVRDVLRAHVMVLAFFTALWCVGTPARAQDLPRALQVVGMRPDTLASLGGVLTISFDRPVVGALGATDGKAVDPATFVRISPALDARIEWRDPVSIRIVPRKALRPGSSYTVHILPVFRATDGSRLSRAHELTVRVRGTGWAGSRPGLNAWQQTMLPFNGRLELLSFIEVDSAAIVHAVAMEIDSSASCGRQRVPFRLASVQRGGSWAQMVSQFDLWHVRTDTSVMAFASRWRFEADQRLPDGCSGSIVVPSLDSTDTPLIRYRIAATPRFRLAEPPRLHSEDDSLPSLSFFFTSDVSPDSIRKYVHVEPAGAITPFSVAGAQSYWNVLVRAQRGTRISLRIDSALRDIHGRAIGTVEPFTALVPGRNGALGNQTSTIVLPRSASPTIRLRYINVDSIRISVVRVPDELLASALRSGATDKLRAQRDAIVSVLQLPRAGRDEERVIDLPLPRTVDWLDGTTRAIRIDIQRLRGTLTDSMQSAGWANPRPVRSNGRNGAPVILPLVRVVSSNPGMYTSPGFLTLQFSDIAVHALLGGLPSAALVTSRASGLPLAGVRLSLLDTAARPLATAYSDSSGLVLHSRLTASDSVAAPLTVAEWERSRERVAMIEARLGQDRLLLPRTRGGALSVIELHEALQRDSLSAGTEAWRLPEPAIRRATMWSDRGIYRPGEPVFFGAIVRDGPAGVQRTPAPGDSVQLLVQRADEWGLGSPPDMSGDTDGLTIHSSTHALSTAGSVTDSTLLSAGTSLGYYRIAIRMRDGSEWREVNAMSFRVAEYRAPDFLVTADIDSGARFVGDTAHVRLGATFLFGAPMARATWQSRIEYRANAFGALTALRIPEGFAVGDAMRWMRQRNVAETADERSGSGALDSMGRAEVAVVPPSMTSRDAPVVANVQVAVTDRNRQSVSVASWQLFHSSSFYLAVASSIRGVKLDTMQVRVAALTPAGRRVGGRRVSLELMEWNWTSVDTITGAAGKWSDTAVWRGSLETNDSIASLWVPIPAAPQFRIIEVVARSVDDAGRPVRSSVARWVQGTRAFWSDDLTADPLALPLLLDDAAHTPGDTVRLRFDSPFDDAIAWITLQREGVLWQELRTVKRGVVSVRIPLRAESAPNAVVGVLLSAAGVQPQSDKVIGRARFGFTEVRVSADDRRLRVAIMADHEQYAPGDRPIIRVRVRDHLARPVRGRVSVWAVDEGVLSLTAFRTPDPFAALYAIPRATMSLQSSWNMGVVPTPPWTAFFANGRRMILNSTSMLHQSLATRPASSAQEAPRRDMRATAFYAGELELDDRGEAVTRPLLPDNITTFRIMAVAADDHGRAGSADTSMLVTKELLLRAALPRFVRTGDSVHAGAMVNLRNLDARAVSVSASATGLRRVGPDNVRAMADASGTEVRFAWTVPGPGARAADSTASVTLRATDGVRADAVMVSLPVRGTGKPRVRSLSGMLRDSAHVKLTLSSGTDMTRTSVTVHVGRTPLPFLRLAMRYVDGYPYECTEQLASRLRVVLAAVQLERAGVRVSIDTLASLEKARALVNELERRTSETDGVRYWRNHSWSTVYLSQYAGTALLEARDAGLRVSSDKLDALRSYQRAHMRLPRDAVYGNIAARRAFSATELSNALQGAWFLRRSGEPDKVLESALLLRVGEMHWEDRAWTAELLALAGNRTAARDVLDKVWSEVRDAGASVDVPSTPTPWYFTSSLRPATRLLSATRAVSPEHPRIGALVERIISDARSRKATEWNTHDFGVSAPVLAAYIADEGPAANAADTTYTLSAATLTRDGSAQLSVPVRGRTGAFYSVTVQEVPRARPVTPDRLGLVVERWYERYSDGKPVTQVAEGELVRVRLRVTARAPRQFVAVDDALPAGLEAVDMSLQTTGLGPFADQASREAERQGAREDGDEVEGWMSFGSFDGGWWSPWEHKELRDDRVLWFARRLQAGTHTMSYVARATTAGRFVRPPAHAEEMYNPGVNGRSDGGWFLVAPKTEGKKEGGKEGK